MPRATLSFNAYWADRFGRAMWQMNTSGRGAIALLVLAVVLLGWLAWRHDCRHAYCRTPPDWLRPPAGGATFRWLVYHNARLNHSLMRVFSVVHGHTALSTLQSAQLVFCQLLVSASCIVTFVGAQQCTVTQAALAGLVSAACSAVTVTSLRQLFKAGHHSHAMVRVFRANEAERRRARPKLPGAGRTGGCQQSDHTQMDAIVLVSAHPGLRGRMSPHHGIEGSKPRSPAPQRDSPRQAPRAGLLRACGDRRQKAAHRLAEVRVPEGSGLVSAPCSPPSSPPSLPPAPIAALRLHDADDAPQPGHGEHATVWLRTTQLAVPYGDRPLLGFYLREQPDGVAPAFVPVERVRLHQGEAAHACLSGAIDRRPASLKVEYLASNLPSGRGIVVASEHVLDSPPASQRSTAPSAAEAQPRLVWNGAPSAEPPPNGSRSLLGVAQQLGATPVKSVRALMCRHGLSRDELMPTPPGKATRSWARARVQPSSPRPEAVEPPLALSCRGRPLLAFAWLLSVLLVGGCAFWLTYFAMVLVDEQLELQEKSADEYLGQLAGAYAFSILQSYLVMDNIKVLAITVVSPQFMRSLKVVRSEPKKNALRYCAQSAASGLYAFLVFIF